MKTYIRYPLNIKLIFAMAILILINIFTIIGTNNIKYELFHLVLCTIFILIIILAIIRRFLKPRILQLDSEVLMINNNRIKVEDINVIYIENNRIIGIKPKKNRIVPFALCFEFFNNCNETSTLIDWAKNNNIDLKNKVFIKWI